MIYIIGAGYMAREYAKVLKKIDKEFLIVGRGKESVKQLKDEMNVDAVAGGITKLIENKGIAPVYAIVCTPVESLASITIELLLFGVKNILLEKPGALSVNDLIAIKELSAKKNAQVLIGYNRRFYQATIALEQRLKEEQLIAVNFEITEWSHVIVKDPSPDTVKQKWVIANTSHVIDLVTYIIGPLKELAAFSSGGLAWHNSASRFVGAGVSEDGILISYCGYWDGPGRWSAEFVTTKNRYILRPMERLAVQNIGAVSIDEISGIDYSIDENFKPGLFLQVSNFLDNKYERFCTIQEQIFAFELYEKISGYDVN